MPGYLAGRAPRNKGMQYPPDPPRPEEIILVMRRAGHDRHGLRIRALIAILLRGGLRITEALALNETDIDERRGSLLVRHGKGDKRREAGMDQFGFEQLAAWLAHRALLPPGPLFCVIDGRTRGRRWAATAARTELRELALAGQHHPAPTRAHRPRNHVGLSPGHRSERDHRRRPLPQTTHDLGHRRTRSLTTSTTCAARGPRAGGWSDSASALFAVRLDAAVSEGPLVRRRSGSLA
jgi:integrase